MEEWSSGPDAREGLAAKCDGMGDLVAIADQAASAPCSCQAQTHPLPQELATAPAADGADEVSCLRSEQGAREWCCGGEGGMRVRHALLPFLFSRRTR